MEPLAAALPLPRRPDLAGEQAPAAAAPPCRSCPALTPLTLLLTSQVLTGLQLPAGEEGRLAPFLAELGYAHTDETHNQVYETYCS